MSGIIQALGFKDADELQALVALAGILGAVVAFLIGLRQYQISQKWKVKEFVANEMKEFFEDWRVRNALLLIDWGSRQLKLEAPSESSNEPFKRVTRAIQISSLRPHTMLGEEGAADAAATEEDYSSFSILEAQIRDTYDCLLDYFERFSGFLESDLVPVDELRPYLQYWIDDIAATKGKEEDLLWTLALFTYIQFYRFTGTVRLFSEFGYDISVGGPIWNSIAENLPMRDLAAQLEAALKGDVSVQKLDEGDVANTA